jgi:two-component system phosphate regulon sensor histidine kinase PhoR
MKRRFQIIILLMIVSLFGIILIQVLWIRSAIQAEEERFDKAVFNAMSAGVSNLKQKDLFYFIDRKIDLPRPAPPIYDSIIESYIPAPAQVEVLRVDSNMVSLDDGNARIVLADTSKPGRVVTIVKPEGSYVVKWSYDTALYYKHEADINYRFHDEDVEWEDQYDKWHDEYDRYIDHDEDHDEENEEVIVLGQEWRKYSELVELENVEALEELKNLEEYVIIESQLDSIENVIRLRQEIRAEKERVVEDKMKEFNQVMQQWAFEYSFDDTDFRAGADLSQNVDTIISRALENNGIDLDFDSQLVRNEGDTSILLTNDDRILDTKYKTEIFPNDFFRKNLFLVLDFPGRSGHIYRSVSWLGMGSLLFTTIILLTFGMTLYYIQKQKKLSDIKSDFINNMTHEFKTPIATINLASDTMSSPKVMGNENQVKYYLDIIRQENKRMNNQVEKVLQMALIENQDFQLDFVKTDIHTIIENTIHVAELVANEKGGKIVSVLRATCSEIPVDEIHFSNIINNLLDNAIKYTEKEPEILVETFTTDNRVLIRISDNGVGMSKEVQKHIFDKFYRRSSGNIHNIKGFGLGLSYVKAIVDAHGGEISVSSEPGNGSIFTLSFDC